jgi:hypothetical protein
VNQKKKDALLSKKQLSSKIPNKGCKVLDSSFILYNNIEDIKEMIVRRMKKENLNPFP